MPGIDCNLFGPTEPCDPSLLDRPSQNLRLILRSRQLDPERRQRAPAEPANTLRELFAEFRACWVPPPVEQAWTGMELTVRFSLNRMGAVIGQPRFTYVNRAAKPSEQELYRRNVLDMLAQCTPIALTAGLGGAIAGRPIAIRFIEDRGERGNPQRGRSP